MQGQGISRITKLREKAEVSRHIHGELVRKKRWQGRLLYAGVQIIGVLVAVAGGAYFRMAGGGSSSTSTLSGFLLWMMMILPAVGTVLIILDATMFRLRDQEEAHKKAVEIWGDWIRRASEAIGENPDCGDGSRTTRKAEEAYRRCMRKTPGIPLSTKQFLKYKREFIEKRNESRKLDQKKEWKHG